MAHRGFLADISSGRAYVLNPQSSWNTGRKSNMVPRSSSNGEIEVVTLRRPRFSSKVRNLLPSIDTKVSDPYLSSFVLSSPTASFRQMVIEDKMLNDSPIVVR